ncbi:MAG: HD domain-containing phosphohydrolase [Vibrio gallaecicus]|uniref:HD domain-containing phosphohydrolase n=2 Tax=Vibrio gallaecicus TaxID=552386 RepID=UPI0010CA01D6|nr:HD domain-containing phosphohydrolase [Vibrio gallaecicus]MDN3613755.1 HD domain-containing phosphohydrolase [Vibrio gallaecicus]
MNKGTSANLQKGLSMDKSNYNASLTFKLYVIAGALFGIYGGRVCPMLETLTAQEVLTHVSIVFSIMFLIRHFVLTKHPLVKETKFAQLDTTLFFAASVPFALYYSMSYDFPIDSNLKVLFGMSLFGFFTGTILQLVAKLAQMDEMDRTGQFDFSLSGQRISLVKQMIWLVVLLLGTLTTMLTMVAVKDVFWLEHNPARLLDGTGKISVIKEFIFLSVVLAGYAVTIMMLWSKLIKRVLLSQECSLEKVTKGDTNVRLPIFGYDELGSMASLTNSMLDSLESAQTEVKTTRDVAIVSLSALAESRDNETGAHILRTQEYVKVLAEHLSLSDKHSSLLSPQYIELLYKSAPLHDVGKVGIPDNVLLKPGKLTDEEFEIMKGHPKIGAEALSIAEKQLGSSSFLRVAKEISLTHHEKWNGSGYPNQLSGEDIPLSGRLMALADVYDALISKRIYKPAFSHDKAKSIILEGNGTHFDPQVVDAFLAVEDKFVDIASNYKDGKADLSELERESFITQPV